MKESLAKNFLQSFALPLRPLRKETVGMTCFVAPTVFVCGVPPNHRRTKQVGMHQAVCVRI